MSEHPISRFDVPDLDDLPDDIRDTILGVQEKAGFVPNVFLAFARRPAEFRAFFAFHDALMESDEGLSKAEREMIVVATSAENQCLYCVVSHGAILRAERDLAKVLPRRLPDRIRTSFSSRKMGRKSSCVSRYVVLVAHTLPYVAAVCHGL